MIKVNDLIQAKCNDSIMSITKDTIYKVVEAYDLDTISIVNDTGGISTYTLDSINLNFKLLSPIICPLCKKFN